MTYRRMALALLALTLCLQSSCVQSPFISQGEFVGAISAAILTPSLTCDQLKNFFGVPYIPTVEDPGHDDQAEGGENQDVGAGHGGHARLVRRGGGCNGLLRGMR